MASSEYAEPASESARDLFNALLEIVRIRRADVSEFDNLVNIFMRGRKVGKLPAGSTDVDDLTDRIGDFNFDADYLYICVDDSGAAWRRIALTTW